MLDNIPYLPYFISAFIGIGLAAASGFRVFLPMFAVSLASYMGWIPMNENFQWLAGLPTLITTGIATVVEILAYYIPYVDHLLDTASVPLATIAGSIIPNYALIDKNNLHIVGEEYLNIHHHLMALKGQQIDDIQEVWSHPMALLQCKEFFKKYPNIRMIEDVDTAEVAKRIAQKQLKGIAAIAPKIG